MLAAFALSIALLLTAFAAPSPSASASPSPHPTESPFSGWKPGTRDWVIPKTRPGQLELLPVTDDWSVTVRRIGMRSRDARLDVLGDVTIYPVVLSPKGEIYQGFLRKYARGTIGRKWLYWEFPSQFQAPGIRPKTEEEADFGEHLLDNIILDTGKENKVIPSGVYVVKWVVNNLLIDNGDKFRYKFHKNEPDR